MTDEAFGPTISDRVAAGDGHDGNGARRLPGRLARRRAAGKNDVDLQPHQLRSLRGQPIGNAFRVAPLDEDVASLDIPELLQTLPDACLRVRVGARRRGA